MEKFNCLVFIDDDHPTNYYHEIIANDADVAHKMFFFQSGERALEELREGKERKTPLPEIIFLDINMPRMNGWEFLEEYKVSLANPETKVIILTTSSNPADKEKADSHPWVSKFLSKPLTVEIFNELRAEWF